MATDHTFGKTNKARELDKDMSIFRLKLNECYSAVANSLLITAVQMPCQPMHRVR